MEDKLCETLDVIEDEIEILADRLRTLYAAREKILDEVGWVKI